MVPESRPAEHINEITVTHFSVGRSISILVRRIGENAGCQCCFIDLLTSFTVSDKTCARHMLKETLGKGYDGDNIYRNFQIQHHYVQIDSRCVAGRRDFRRENGSQ